MFLYDTNPVDTGRNDTVQVHVASSLKSMELPGACGVQHRHFI